jgi:ferritin-like metal-binding protein YciE
MKMKNPQASAAQNGSQKSAKTVKAKPDAADGLRGLLVDGLKDIYWAENALVKALPKMIKNATSDELAEALSAHLEETKQHVSRVEQAFAAIDENAQGKKCDAMAGLIEEADGIMEETEAGVVRDAGIIAAAQKIEHYEIATYGTLATFARTLGEEEAAELLHETLLEEKEADEKLSEIAESSINVEAAEDDEAAMEEVEENSDKVTYSKSKK